MQCLDERKLKDYLHGSLPAELIIPASEHVRSCEACRTKLAELAEYVRASASIGAISTSTEDCPEYDTLSAFVAEQLVGETFTEVEHHILHCELCWQDVETLQSARSRASLAPEISVVPGAFSRRRTWTVFGWRSAAATALGAAAVAVVLMLANPATVQNPGKHATTVASNIGVHSVAPVIKNTTPTTTKTHVVEPVNNETPAPSENVRPNVPTPEPESIAMNDGSVTVYTKDGKLAARASGGDLEATVAAAVNEKLKRGKVNAPFQIAMAGTGGVRSTGDGAVEISRMTPESGSLTSSGRPMFKWAEVSGAESYRIDISRADGTTVVSQETSQNQFQLSQSLPAGFYKWQVGVRKGELAGWAVSHSQMLRVLSKSESEMLAAAKRSYSDSHLVMGTVYQKLGLNKQAAAEFRALVRENPESEVAKTLLAGVPAN